MYDVYCSNINDSISFWGMTSIEVDYLFHDYNHQYNIRITNDKTKQEYMIITKDDYIRFLESEGLRNNE